MLSVPTLWTVFVINFLALGLIWAYVMRSYPSFEAARFWTGSAFVAAAGAALAMLRVVFPDSLIPLLFAGTALILAICLAAMGIRKFFNQPVSWRDTLLITGLGVAGLCFFTFVHDSVPARMTVFTIAQALPMLRSLKLLLSPHEGHVNPGARLAGIVTILIMAIFVARWIGAVTTIEGGGFSYMHFSPAQSVVILVLVFLSMALNFGFLLMAMDRLRNEVADLALLDDLTGVGNRRYLLQRVVEECARSERSGQPFALLVIDLDSFKAINDEFGHAAGDKALRQIADVLRSNTRVFDSLARYGGEEFVVVMPGTGLDDASQAAERLRAAVESTSFAWEAGGRSRLTVSIGVACSGQGSGTPEALLHAADLALYTAKRGGRNRIELANPVAPSG